MKGDFRDINFYVSRNIVIIKKRVLEKQGELNESVMMGGKFIMYFLQNWIDLIDIKISQG